MKKQIVWFWCLCLTLNVSAQVSRSIHLPVDGTLGKYLADEAATIEKLTVSGNINVLDIKFIRDEMPVLTELDMGEANIVNYYDDGKHYVENSMPYRAFYNNKNIQIVELPSTLTDVNEDAFRGCSNLSTILFPQTLISIGKYAFSNCDNLSTILLPQNLLTIESYAFQNCSNLSTIIFPPTLTYIGNYAFFSCSNLSTILFPQNLLIIGNYAFSNCSNLSTILLPQNLLIIENYAFSNCSKLTTIVNLNPDPIPISANVFNIVNKNACTLTVPTSSLEAYQNASIWREFFNIQEGGYVVNAQVNNPLRGKTEGLKNNFYTAGSTVSLTAVANDGFDFVAWTMPNGEIVSTDVVYSFTINQNMDFVAVFNKELNLHLTQAGTLQNQEYAANATKLTITGYIDARDVKFMRDQMPYLEELDLSNAVIVEYTGTEGTADTLSITYPANEMPQNSFSINIENYTYCYGKASLMSVIFPTGLTSIGNMAFGYCNALTTITLPAGIKSIGYGAFVSCYNLKEVINLNPTPIFIERLVFANYPYNFPFGCSLKVSSSSLDLYRNADVWKEFFVTSGYVVDIALKDGVFATVSGGGIYDPYTSVTVTANSNADYTFTGWTSGVDNTVVSTGNFFDFTLMQDTVLTANFVGTRAELKTLTVSRGLLTPAFSPDETNYSIIVGNEINNLTLNASASQKNATIKGTGTIALEHGENQLDIEVISEDEMTVNTYSILVKRTSSDARLESLTVSQGVLTPEFGTETTNYSVDLDNNIGNITVEALALHANATLQGCGLKLIPVGSTVFDIMVTAEDETTKKTYTIEVSRAEGLTTAVIEPITSEVGAYPNPTQGMVYITQRNGEIPFVNVYDNTGKLLLETRGLQVDLSAFAQGIYLLQVNNEKIIKITKQ